MRLAAVTLLFTGSACGTAAPPDAPAGTPAGAAAPCVPRGDPAAPSYTELFTRYFAPGTPGHCATAHCHADPGVNVWSCGESAATCYAGMLQVGLLDGTEPARSLLVDPARSPLAWVSPSGDMPFDAVAPLPEGRDAIMAWIAECAPAP